MIRSFSSPILVHFEKEWPLSKLVLLSNEEVDSWSLKVTARVCDMQSLDRLNIFKGEKVKENDGKKRINQQTWESSVA